MAALPEGLDRDLARKLFLILERELIAAQAERESEKEEAKDDGR